MLYMPVMTNKNSSWQLIRRMGREYVAPYKKKLALAVFCMVVMAACTTFFAHLIQPLFDEGFIGQNRSVMMWVPVLLLVATFLKGLASYGQSYLMECVGQKVVADLQLKLYTKLTGQDLAFFHRHPVGSLTSRFTYDLHRINYSITTFIGGGLRDVTVALGLLGNLFWKDWQLALASMVIIPLMIYPIRRFGKMMRKYGGMSQGRTGDLTAMVSETLMHNRQVKAYTAEGREIERAHKRILDVLAATLKAVRTRALTSPVIELVATMGIVVIIYLGLYQTAQGHLTTGAFASFLTSLLMMVRPIKGVSNLNNTLQEGLAAVQRTFELIDETPTVQEKAKAKALKIKKAEVAFENVSFAYEDGTNALENLNFKIPAGKTIALVGESGAGKSTILNLIPRFFDASGGAILIDGQNVKDVSLKSLRQNIGLVSQDVAIFDDTIFANIAYGNPNATEEEVIKAAQDAAAHNFIEELEEGYQTQVGENGAKLSGGQRQRISIARALLKGAPILLLDEATASLDTESEKQIQDALKKLAQGRTTLVIAHRLSTITDADEIYVLEKGTVAEHGTHEELLKKEGAYARLYQLQTGNNREE